MKKYIFALLFLALYNVLFLYPQLIQKKTLITPEFGGGDSVVVYLPYRFFLCKKIKEGKLPFWTKDINSGFPLLAEGEIGSFNILNILSCLISKDYKDAFNISIFLHILLCQFGILLLGKELRFSWLTRLFLSSFIPYLPIFIQNYMQVTLTITTYALPLMLYGLFRLIRTQSKSSMGLFILTITIQLLITHYQIVFYTFVFLNIILFLYLFSEKVKNRTRLLILFYFSYLLAVGIAGVQILPALEFFLNSNRIQGGLASQFDQNLTFLNLITIFFPNFFGKVQDGSYEFFRGPHPWESTFFIYYLPLFFLFIAFIKRKKIINLDFFYLLFFGFVIVTLLGLGKNSPLYLVHQFPFFSSFRFPSRFNLISVLLLSLLSGFGFEIVVKTLKKNRTFLYTFFIISVVLVFFESRNYYYNFHVLYPNNKLFTKIKTVEMIPKELSVYTPYIDVSKLNKKYISEGYKQDKDFYYLFSSNLILGNLGVIFDLRTLHNKIGPQLKRYPYVYSVLANYSLQDEDTLVFSQEKISLLKLLGVNYLLSTSKIKNLDSFLEKRLFIKDINKTVYIYKISPVKKVRFFTRVKLINTLSEFMEFLKNSESNKFALVEDINLMQKFQKQNDWIEKESVKLEILKYSDTEVVLNVKNKKEGILVLYQSFYPNWQAFDNGVKTKILRTNFVFQGIFLKPGSHKIVFRYVPYSFYLGVIVSIVSIVGYFLILKFRKLCVSKFS